MMGKCESEESKKIKDDPHQIAPLLNIPFQTPTIPTETKFRAPVRFQRTAC